VSAVSRMIGRGSPILIERAAPQAATP